MTRRHPQPQPKRPAAPRQPRLKGTHATTERPGGGARARAPPAAAAGASSSSTCGAAAQPGASPPARRRAAAAPLPLPLCDRAPPREHTSLVKARKTMLGRRGQKWAGHSVRIEVAGRHDYLASGFGQSVDRHRLMHWAENTWVGQCKCNAAGDDSALGRAAGGDKAGRQAAAPSVQLAGTLPLVCAAGRLGAQPQGARAAPVGQPPPGYTSSSSALSLVLAYNQAGQMAAGTRACPLDKNGENDDREEQVAMQEACWDLGGYA